MIREQPERQRCCRTREQAHTSYRDAARVDSDHESIPDVLQERVREEGIPRINAEIWTQDPPAQICAIDLQYRHADEEGQKPTVISTSQTIVDPGTVVVAFRHAVATEAAVFGPRWLQDMACRTHCAWPEQDVVKGIVGHSCGMVGWRDVVCCVRGTQEGEDVRSRE